MVTGDLIEVVAMDQQKAATVGGFVDLFPVKPDIPECRLAIIPERLVMVAGDQDHLLIMSGTAQDLLDHGVLGPAPVNAAPHAPEIDNIPHQVKMPGGMFTEEVQKTFCLAGTGSQVNVRNEYGADCGHGGNVPAEHDISVTP